MGRLIFQGASEVAAQSKIFNLQCSLSSVVSFGGLAEAEPIP